MTARVFYRQFWGATKHADLLATLSNHSVTYAEMQPVTANRHTMRRANAVGTYDTWPTVRDLSLIADWSGVLEARRGALMDYRQDQLRKRIETYLDPSLTFEQVRSLGVGPTEEAARFDPRLIRQRLLLAGGVNAGSFRQIALSPFDQRWCFHSSIRPLWNEPRPELALQHAKGIHFFIARDGFRRPEVGFPTYALSALPSYSLFDPNCHPVPFALADDSEGLFRGAAKSFKHNLSPAALAWTAALNLPPTADTSRLVWHHALATTHAPSWLSDNAAAIRAGWPRIPTPADRDALEASAALGARLAALLDPDTPVPGVTTGALPPVLAAIAVPRTRPGADRDWRLTNWGSRSEAGITMPGRGEATPRPHHPDVAPHAPLLGPAAVDLRMNPASAWDNVPDAVWTLRIGGYQVLKKWLSYRDASILARPLTEEEVTHVSHTARRLAAILLMGPDLDAAHAASAAAHAPLPAAPV